MDTPYDVFANLTDFCENFTANVASKPELKLSLENDESDNEVENFFLAKKAKGGTRNSKKPGGLTVSGNSQTKTGSAETVVDEDAANSTDTLLHGENRNPRRRSQRLNKQVQTDLGSNEEQVELSPRRRRRRGNRRNDCDILQYMQSQTAAVLAQATAPIPSNTQRGRARRRYMAEVASNAPVIGVVDLAGPKTPPLPPRSSFGKKVIDLDSEDEFSFKESLNGSLDFGNEELSVKVKWADKIDIIPHRRHQKFRDMMIDFANKNGVEQRDILLNLNDKIVEADDTPDSINYNIAQFISARIVRSEDYVPIGKRKDPHTIKLKIQSDTFKRPFEVRMKKDQNFKILLIKCSEELRIPCEQIKLSFDGEPLVLSETSEDLEFEGGEVIDCCIAK